jgi:hypothetical protein
MSLKTENSRRVAKSRPVCTGLYSLLLAILYLYFIKNLLKFTKSISCENEIYLLEIIKLISLSPCSRYNANFKLDQSVLVIHDSPLYYEISEDDHPPKHAQ